MKFKLSLLVLMFISINCYAGIGHWLHTEVLPTMTGKRPLKIDPHRVSIVHGGKPILKYEGDSLYIKAAGVTFQTSKLRQRIAEAGAIYSGDYQVLTKVAAEQLNKELQQGVQNGEITASDIAPPVEEISVPENTTAIGACSGKSVTLYNQTLTPIRYAMSGATYEVASGAGNTHCEANGDFFLQYDDDVTDGVNIARYYLSGDKYRLFLSDESHFIHIAQYTN